MDATYTSIDEIVTRIGYLKAAGASQEDHEDNGELLELIEFTEFLETEPHYADQTDFIDALLNHTRYSSGTQLATVTDIIKDAEYIVHDSLEAYGEDMMDCMDMNLPDWAVSHFDVEGFAQDCLNSENDYFTLEDGTIIILSN